jgi:flagellar biosynthesis protein FlhG
MRDQASGLRERWQRAAPAARVEVTAPTRDDVHALVVGAGKGGVGVSVLSVLLASAMARRGRRVLLLDATLNLGNLHVLLSCPPVHTLRSLLAGEVMPHELVIPVTERLWLLPAESGAESVHALTPMDRARLYVRLATLMDDYDVTVVDAGTGLESVLRAVLTRASRLVTVTTPDPAALADTYALINILSLEAPALPVDVLVNRVSDRTEGKAAWQRLNDATGRFLGRALGWLGAIAEDDQLARRVRECGSLLELDDRVAGMAERSLESLETLPAGGRCSA